MKLRVFVLQLCSCSLSVPAPGHHVLDPRALQYHRFSEQNNSQLSYKLTLISCRTFFTVLGTMVVFSIGIFWQETHESDFKLVLQ